MNQFKFISGISLCLLVLTYVVIFSYRPDLSEIELLIPVFILGGLNLILSSLFLFAGNRDKARSFLLSSLIVLVVGSSSCVTIKPRKKPKKKKKPPVETPPPVHVQDAAEILKNCYLALNEKNIQ